MKQNLIIFSYDFPPSNGGIARLCQEIAVGMQKFYNSVTVLTRSKKGPNKPYNSDLVRVVELPNKRLKCEYAALRYLSAISNKESYDVLCGTWHPEGTLVLFSGFRNIYILGHGTEFLSGTSFFRKYFWLPIYCKWVLNSVNKIIANSNYTKKIVHTIEKKAKVEALALGVNEAFFTPNKFPRNGNSKLKIGTISRVEKFKGYDFIAEVIAQLPLDLRNKIEWNIGGTGSYSSELIYKVEELGISNQVNFLGFIKDESLSEFYNSIDIFILCTRENSNSTSVEGFGLVFLEAQSCGVPVIGTRTGGIPDAIEHNNGGWLIEQDNVNELSTLMRSILEDSTIVTQMGILARNRVVSSCTWDIYCKKLSNLMKS